MKVQYNGDCQRTSKCTCTSKFWDYTDLKKRNEHSCILLTQNHWYDVMFESQFDYYTINCDLDYIATFRKNMFLTEHEYLTQTRKLKLQKLKLNE